MRKYEIKSKTIAVSNFEMLTFDTKFGVYLERAMICFRMKKSNHWYPGMVAMYSFPLLSIFTPNKSVDNDEWIMVNQNDIDMKIM